MSYSDTQFQRALLKTLDKIADELHKSNKITDKEVKHDLKASINLGAISKDDIFKNFAAISDHKDDVKPDEKKEDQGYKTVRYEEFIDKYTPENILFDNIYNEIDKTHCKYFDEFVLSTINRLTGWNIDIDAPDIPFLTEHVDITAYDVIGCPRDTEYWVRIDGEFLFSFFEWFEYDQDPSSTFGYKAKVVYKIINERKLEDVDEETDSTSKDLE